MVFIEDDFGGGLLLEMEFAASLVPQLMTVSKNLGSLDTIHHDDAIGNQYRQYLRHDSFQPSAVSANEDGIWLGKGRNVCFKEIADMYVEAWGAEAMGILVDDGFTFRTDFESLDVQMRELQAGLDGDAACAEADIPKHMATR